MLSEGIHSSVNSFNGDIALARPGVRHGGRMLSMYVAPDDAPVTMDLDFNAGTGTADAAPAMAEVERRVRER